MKKRLKMKKMKSQESECPTCNGHGQYEDSYDDMYGGNHPMGWFDCYRCDGTGNVNLLREFKTNQNADKFSKKFLSHSFANKSREKFNKHLKEKDGK